MHPLNVLHGVMLTVDGKDKTLKSIQYTLKFLLLSSPQTNLAALASALSTGRRILRLGRFLDPYLSLAELLSGHRGSGSARKEFFSLALSLLNDLLDDILTLNRIARLGLDPAISSSLERTSSLLWLVSCVLALEGQAKSSSPVAFLALGKLLADTLFCLLDVFPPLARIVPGSTQVAAGLVAGLLGWYGMSLKIQPK